MQNQRSNRQGNTRNDNGFTNIHYMGKEQKTWTKNIGGKSMIKGNKNVVKKENNNKFNRDNKMYNKTELRYDCKKCGTNHNPRSCPAFGEECRVCNKLNDYEIGCKNKK